MLENQMRSMMIRNDKRGEQKTEESNPVRIVGGLESPSSNIYYNLSIINKVVTDPAGILPSISVPKIAEYSTNRTTTILENPSKYRVAVSRLAIPSGLIPLFLFPQNPSYYAVTLSYNDGINPVSQYTRNLVYVPSAVGDVYAQYNPVYYINELIQYVNVAYKEAFDLAVADLGAIVYLPKVAPYVVYDSKTKLITLYAEEEYLDFTSFGVFMNTTLFENFFSGLYAREAATNVLGGFNGFQILPQNLYTNVDQNAVLPGSGIPVTLYKVIEEFSSVPLFNTLDRIVVTTHRMPITSALIGTQVDSRARILYDFILPDDVQTKTKYELDPTRLRWIDLASHTPMTSIDIQLLLIYNDGQIINLFIQSDQRIDCTLLFVPKGTFYQ